MAPIRVGIAGAGIAGLTTALSLAHRGIGSTVFERVAELSEVGAGLQVSPNAGRVLERLGLTAALDRAAVMPDAIDMRSGRTGEPIVSLPLGEAARAAYGAPYRLIHRADLQALLLEAVRAEPSITLQLDTSALAVSQSAESVTLTVNGAKHEFDCVIASDGVRSTLRAAVPGAAPPLSAGRTAWRTTMPIGLVPRDLPLNRTTVLLNRAAHVVIYPVRGARLVNVIVVIEEDWDSNEWSAPGDPAMLLRRFDCDETRFVNRFTSLDLKWTRWCLMEVDPRANWVHGRLALIGDAAHAMVPFVAQGAAMAIEDADSIAEALATAPVPEALRRFEAVRRPRATRVWRTARQAGQIYHLGGPMASARDVTMTVMGGERLMRRYDWIYGWQADECEHAASENA
jgi:salicylate hydroxylase